MTIQQILEAVMALQSEIEATPAGAPAYPAIVSRIAQLQSELARARAVLGPLIPDASRPKTDDEDSASDLQAALESLMEAATSKR